MEHHTVDCSFFHCKIRKDVFLCQNPLTNYNTSKDSQENETRYSRRFEGRIIFTFLLKSLHKPDISYQTTY